jgi:DNA-binding response OmpR family regulator
MPLHAGPLADDGDRPVKSSSVAGKPSAARSSCIRPSMAVPGMDAGVLLVEDDNDLNDAVCAVLREEGYDPLCMDSAPAAAAILATRRFELAIVDLRLGAHSGEELVEILADMRIPTILYSATEKDGREVAERWSIPFVSKPFDIDELLSMVRAVVRERCLPQRPMSA